MTQVPTTQLNDTEKIVFSRLMSRITNLVRDNIRLPEQPETTQDLYKAIVLMESELLRWRGECRDLHDRLQRHEDDLATVRRVFGLIAPAGREESHAGD